MSSRFHTLYIDILNLHLHTNNSPSMLRVQIKNVFPTPPSAKYRAIHDFTTTSHPSNNNSSKTSESRNPALVNIIDTHQALDILRPATSDPSQDLHPPDAPTPQSDPRSRRRQHPDLRPARMAQPPDRDHRLPTPQPPSHKPTNTIRVRLGPSQHRDHQHLSPALIMGRHALPAPATTGYTSTRNNLQRQHRFALSAWIGAE